MSKKLFLAVLPLLALAMASCSRGNGGATTSSGGNSGAGDSSLNDSSAGDESSEEDTSADEGTSVDESVDPAEVDAAVSIGSLTFEMEEMDRDAGWPDNLTKQYTAVVHGETGDAIKVYLEGTEVTDPGAETAATNNVKSDLTLKRGGSNLNVYFKVWEDGGHGLYITTPAAEPGEGNEFTLNAATDQATWAFNEVPIFVWSWPEGGTGAWTQVEYTGPAASVTVELPDGIAGFVVVRCHADTVTPDWDMDKNAAEGAGKIYNKSNDVIVDGGTEYTVTFSDYYK